MLFSSVFVHHPTIVVSSDPYWSSVTYLTQFTGFSSSKPSVDATGRHTSITFGGGLSGITDPFGNSDQACAVTGTATAQTVANNTTDWGPGRAVWTVEFWFYPTSSAGNGIEFLSVGSDVQFYWFQNTYIQCNYNNNSYYIVTAFNSFPVNAWSHYALCWDGTTLRSFANGALSGQSGTASTNNPYTSSPASDWSAPNTKASGLSFPATGTTGFYIDEIRVTNAARYTAAFTRPSAPFPTH